MPTMSTDTFKLELPKWYDLHAHFRQGELLEPLLKEHIAMGCAGVLAMPNTAPPVGKVSESESSDFWSIEAYTKMLEEASGASKRNYCPALPDEGYDPGDD